MNDGHERGLATSESAGTIGSTRARALPVVKDRPRLWENMTRDLKESGSLRKVQVVGVGREVFEMS